MSFLFKVFTFTVVTLAFSQLGFAQNGGGGIPGGGEIPGGGGFPIDQGNNFPTTPVGQVNNGGTTSGQSLDSPATADGLNLGPEIPELEDRRREIGFVGRNVSSIEEQSFVGATREGITAISGEGQNGGVTGGRAGGFGGGGNVASLSFTVNRSNVRARVRPNFSFPTVPTAVIESNFNGRMQRLPGLRETVAQGIRVTMQGTTATLSGIVSNQEAIDDMVGQLRMEPGVYRIVNQVEISSPVQLGQNANPLTSSQPRQ